MNQGSFLSYALFIRESGTLSLTKKQFYTDKMMWLAIWFMDYIHVFMHFVQRYINSESLLAIKIGIMLLNEKKMANILNSQ